MKTSKKRVVAAMSGGVDSSVAAALLKKKGYDVIGITLKLWPKEECGFYRPTACCSLEAISDARLVAEKLKIPFYVIDIHKEFEREVINYFTDEYLRGRTPNPCILCNEKIKFGILIKKTLELNAEHVATGHYARISYNRRHSRYILKEGRDKKKDQSYALFSLRQEQLSRILLPLGDYKKERVRKKAKQLGLQVHDKKDSQEICFVQESYADYIKKRCKDRILPGPVKLEDGTTLGTHKGIPFYTVGQRGGLDIPYKYALYVKKIDVNNNTLIVGPKDSTYHRNVIVKDVNWIIPPASGSFRSKTRIRHQHRKAGASIESLNGSVMLRFDAPQESPTPGQAAVFYKRDTVLGGGWIESYEDIKD